MVRFDPDGFARVRGLEAHQWEVDGPGRTGGSASVWEQSRTGLGRLSV